MQGPITTAALRCEVHEVTKVSLDKVLPVFLYRSRIATLAITWLCVAINISTPQAGAVVFREYALCTQHLELTCELCTIVER